MYCCIHIVDDGRKNHCQSVPIGGGEINARGVLGEHRGSSVGGLICRFPCVEGQGLMDIPTCVSSFVIHRVAIMGDGPAVKFRGVH